MDWLLSRIRGVYLVQFSQNLLVLIDSLSCTSFTREKRSCECK